MAELEANRILIAEKVAHTRHCARPVGCLISCALSCARSAKHLVSANYLALKIIQQVEVDPADSSESPLRSPSATTSSGAFATADADDAAAAASASLANPKAARKRQRSLAQITLQVASDTLEVVSSVANGAADTAATATRVGADKNLEFLDGVRGLMCIVVLCDHWLTMYATNFCIVPLRSWLQCSDPALLPILSP